MGYQTILENMIDNKIMQIRTAFIGKVVEVNESVTEAMVQPLNLIKRSDGSTLKQGVVKAPVINSARFKLIEIVPERFEKLKSGDLVFCVCADRDITQAVKGKNVVPELGHHELNNAVVVGIL